MSHKVQENVQKITLTVRGTDFNFTVGRDDYNKYLNSIMPNNKVAPHHNLLMSTVDDDSRDALRTLLKETPGADMNIGGALIEEYTPDLEVVVKKSSSAQSD